MLLVNQNLLLATLSIEDWMSGYNSVEESLTCKTLRERCSSIGSNVTETSDETWKDTYDRSASKNSEPGTVPPCPGRKNVDLPWKVRWHEVVIFSTIVPALTGRQDMKKGRSSELDFWVC